MADWIWRSGYDKDMALAAAERYLRLKVREFHCKRDAETGEWIIGFLPGPPKPSKKKKTKKKTRS